MKFFVCLVALFASAKAIAYVNTPTITIEKVEALVASLENDLQILQQELADGRTRIDEGQAYTNQVIEVFLPRAELDNQQENDRIDDYQAQVKAIQHRVDAARSQVQETSSWALNTRNISQDQLAYLVDPIGVSDTQEDAKIKELFKDIERVKREYLNSLNHTLSKLNHDWVEVRSDIDDFRAYVNSRSCEYGIVSFDSYNPDAASFVPFRTVFSSAPKVSLYLTGFILNLDVYSYDHDKGINLVKYVSQVNTTGFTVESPYALKYEAKEVKQFFGSWVACQGIDGEF